MPTRAEEDEHVLYTMTLAYTLARLQVDVAERTRQGAHQVLDLAGLASPAKVDIVLKGGGVAGRDVEEGICAHEGRLAVLALLGVQHLPDPPHAVDHGVMQVECRVTGGGEDIVTGVATEGVVAAAVDADVSGAGDALHLHLEVVGVLGLEDVAENGRGVGVPSVDGVTQVALQATGVVLEGVGSGFDHAAGEV